MTDPEVVVRLLAAIDEREANAAKIHDERCGLVLGTITGNLNDECDCGIPADLLRLCQSHRDIVARYEHARKRSQTAPAPERILWHARTIALIDVMDLVARGYGIEDGETK